MRELCSNKATAMVKCLSLCLFLFLTPQLGTSQCASGTLEGQVFLDEDVNGRIDDPEKGLSGILITIYDVDGAAVNSTFTETDGSYLFSDLPNDNKFRVEMSYLQNYYSTHMGVDHQSDTRYASVPTCNLNFGLTSNNFSCSDNPEILLTCFVRGELTANPDISTIVGLEHDFNPASNVEVYATKKETGSIWGLAYDDKAHVVYSSAFVKQYAALTNYGHDAIYKTDLDSKTTSLFVKLSDLGINTGSMTVSDPMDCDYSSQVGKIGLGNIVISPDNSSLYAINIYNNSLVRIPLNNPSTSNVSEYNIPAPLCEGGVMRSFALEFHEGKYYVGVTCDASVLPLPKNLVGHVYEFDPSNASFTHVFETDYLRGAWNLGDPADFVTSHWLTDIDFTDEGNMLLGLSDRFGHIFCNEGTGRVDQQYPDLVVVWNDNGVWKLESNGSAGSLSGTGIGNGQGPDGGEFFGADYFAGNPSYHSEVALGSIMVLPGSGEVVAAVYDPLLNAYSGGLHRYNTSNGTLSNTKELYTINPSILFGKATGFGEIISICPKYTGEIGNYVWFDDNSDGLQGPDEERVENVTVLLYNENCMAVGSTVTDANGLYKFNADNVSNSGLSNPVYDGIYANTTYYVALDPAQFDDAENSYILNNKIYNATIADVDTKWGSDLVAAGDICESAAIKYLIPVQLTRVEEVNHKYDIGLVEPKDFDLALRKTVVNNNPKIGEDIIFNIDVFNQGNVVATEVEITDYINPNYSFKSELNEGWTLDGDKAVYTHSQSLLPEESFRVPIVLTIIKSGVLDYTNYAEISHTVDQLGNINSDKDSSADNDQSNDIGAIPGGSSDDEILDNGLFDEDDHDVAALEILDIALRKTLVENKPLQSGEEVAFNIEVFNQGNVDIKTFSVSDYFPNELTFLEEKNEAWKVANAGHVTFKDSEGLKVGQSKLLTIYFQISQFEAIDQIINAAEVSDLISESGNTNDYDSSQDIKDDNDNLVDDTIDDSGEIDEDDHDIAIITSLKVDFALMKTVDKSFVSKGEEAVFDIYIYNQGEVIASEVVIVDYLPEGLIFNDPTWEYNDVTRIATRVIKFPEGLNPGDYEIVTLTTKVSNDAGAEALINVAEILGAKDLSGIEIASFDIDSKPDGDSSNDVGGRPDTEDDNEIFDDGSKDEDDSDPAKVFVIDFFVSNECECLGNATSSTNGQFREELTIIAPTGFDWHIDYVEGLYNSDLSPAPPGAPVPFVTGPGYTLSSTVVDAEYSEFVLTGLLVDGVGYSIRLANEDGVFIQYQSDGCSYESPTVSTDEGESLYAACQSSARTYSVDISDTCTATWSFPDGSMATGEEVEYIWGATNGSIRIDISCAGSCTPPVIIDVEVGAGIGAVACHGDLNVSMDTDCAIEVTPAMIHAGDIDPSAAFGVMLTDKYGNLVPDNMITTDHVGETLTVKLIESCSGNSCWGTIFVEDKQAPVIQCGDISLPCYQMETYEPIAVDNCGSVVSIEMLSEQVKPLNCDDLYTKEITRSYQATDSYGNVSQPCFQTIFVERFDFGNVVRPTNYTVALDNPKLCKDAVYMEDGTPSLEWTGVPTFWGEPLYPVPDYYCNIGVTYETVTISDSGCVRKYMRIWTIYEAHCGLGVIEEFTQTIEIEDQSVPEIVCQDNILISTSGATCDRSVFLPPPIEVIDDCASDDFMLDIAYPGGFLNNAPNGGTVILPVGEHPVKYTVYDGCGNSASCTIQVTIVDETAPTAVCDQFSVVALRGDGTAEVYASSFDDGSNDDCNLYKLLVKRINNDTEACPCEIPVFHDMEYLGEREGHYYYFSKTQTTAFKTFAYANAMGGHPAIIETDDENTWIRNQVDSYIVGQEYFIGLTDRNTEGNFAWSNGFPVNYTNWNGGGPLDVGDYVLAGADGSWSVTGASRQEGYVLEITDPCGWSDYVNFCCDDVGPDHMVALRAVDYSGLVNNCMAMVEVQDKIAPEITCPPDVTIYCDEPYDLNNLEAQFGVATAVDGCQALVEEIAPVVTITQCGTGFIRRRFKATDANGLSACSQRIRIIGRDPFSVDHITWAQDLFTDESCDAGSLDPENLDAPYNKPIISEGFCDLVGVEYKDDVFFFAGPEADACFKILRTWTVIDWCTYDEEDSDINDIPESTDDGLIPGYFVDQQTIKVSNEVKPTINSGTEFSEVCTFECTEGEIELRATASDDCTPNENLVWAYRIDLDSDGDYDYPVISGTGNSIIADGIYPVGDHIILYTFEDKCGNMISAAKDFRIKNCKLPSASCIDGIAVGLEPMDLDGDGTFDTEMACVMASSFNASSNHPCGFDIEFKFCTDPTDPTTFTDEMCFDCSTCGVQTVTLCAIDEFDNVDFCTTTVKVQDNNEEDFCPDASGCVNAPAESITINNCSDNLDPAVIGGMPTIDANCFCDSFDISYDDAAQTYPNSSCASFIRTWTVTPMCGCDNAKIKYEQEIIQYNLEAPGINIPANVTMSADAGECDALVALDLAIASGSCNTGLIISNSFNANGNDASGSYPVGTTTVTYTVTDDCNNTATDSMTVTVVDDDEPTCFAIDFTVGLDAQSMITVTVDQVITGGSDGCSANNDLIYGFVVTQGNTTTTVGSLDFDCTMLGVTDVVVQVSDEEGNSSTCEGSINILDQEGPECNVDDITLSLSSANEILTVTQASLDDNSADNCSVVTFGPDFTFDCGDIGNNVVVVTVSDASGNTSTCEATVTITEDVDPICSVSDLTVNLSGEDTLIELEDISFTSSDPCGEITTTSFTPFTVNCSMLNGAMTRTLVDAISITVSDDFGNESTCTADVILVDNSTPMCVPKDITVFLDESGEASIVAADVDGGSSAGCTGMPMLSIDTDMFFCNQAGTIQTVMLTVTANGITSAPCPAMVTVIDDILPTLEVGFCPANRTISCDDDISDLTIYGFPALADIDDNCPQSYSINEEVSVNVNLCNIGTITRTFTVMNDADNAVQLDADGNPLQCTQIITIDGGSNPITEDDIDWPTAMIDVTCTNGDMDELPIVDESNAECSRVSIDFEDEVINPDGDCDFTILRTWTVIDSCQLPMGVFDSLQIINVMDSGVPVITGGPADQMFDLTGEDDTCATTVSYTYNVTDDCLEPEDLVIVLDAPGLVSQTDIDADGNITFVVEYCTADGDLDVTLTVTDGCGNQTTDSFAVSVVGEECISYNCDKFKFILEEDGGTEINSSEFDPLVVVNNCNHIDIGISYSATDINDTLNVFGCDQITVDNNGNIPDFLYFFENGLLADSCRIVVFFSNDWETICGITSFGATVKGKVMNPNNVPVKDVAIQLDGSPFIGVMTTDEGSYAFPSMDIGGSYVVDPKKDDNHVQGISTLDLILIQKHILGVNKFDSPYKHIAADVNKSNSVSSIDIVELRKLILGQIDEFKSNTSWRMVDEEYVFPDPDDPLSSEFNEVYNINNFEATMRVNFVGVKIGDINSSSLQGLVGANVESRMDKTLTLDFENQSFKKGDEFELSLDIQDFEDLEGTQFGLMIDPSLVRIEEVLYSSDVLCTSANINDVNQSEGQLAISWHSAVPVHSRTSHFMSLKLTALTNGEVSSAISLDNAILNAESYYHNQVANVVLIPNVADDLEAEIVLYQNNPNPWSETTMIKFFISSDQTVNMNIFDINGKLIQTETIDAVKGLNEYEISKFDIETSGVLYYELISETDRMSKKMLLIK